MRDRGGQIRGLGHYTSAGGHVVQRWPPHLWLHDHAGAATVGRIVHGLVNALGPGTEIMHSDMQDSGLDGFAQQRVPKWLEVLGKDGDDV